MNRSRKWLGFLGAVLVARVALIACTKPAPADPDGGGTELGAACANLRALGCPEGTNPDGGKTCFQALTTAGAVAPLPVACLLDAGTVDAVRACGDGTHTAKVRCAR